MSVFFSLFSKFYKAKESGGVMVKQITLDYKENFDCEYEENNVVLSKSLNKKHHVFKTKNLPAKIKMFIRPWKIKPLVRFDGHLVNYGLAKITPWDHMLEFTLDERYAEKYFDSIIDAKRQYLSKTGQNQPDNMDLFVGVNNLEPEMVEKIKALL